jgi:hypothetical protein
MASKQGLDTLVKRLVDQTPAGWKCTTGVGCIVCDGEVLRPGEYGVTEASRWLRYERTDGDVNAVIALNVEKADTYRKDSTFSGWNVEGHTVVNGGSFTRRGIDVSSCELVDREDRRYEHGYGDVASLLAGEWERCVTSVTRKKTAVAVPGLPFSRQPEWFTEASKTLKAGKSVTLAPHGMGVGYTLRKGKPQRWAKRADAQLEQLLGVSPIAVEQYDHD